MEVGSSKDGDGGCSSRDFISVVVTGNEVTKHLTDSDHIIPDFESDLLREGSSN
jgi:hypothetical protein